MNIGYIFKSGKPTISYEVISVVMLAAAGLFACTESPITATAEYLPEIAVEGWIESGETANVIITKTASFSHELDTTWLLNHVIHSAKVSVSDGETAELLTLGTNTNHLPPYVYYGSKIIGKAGKTYSLKVEYDNRIIEAETTIPEPVALDDCWFVRDESQPSIGYVNIRFKNLSDQYYQVATMVSGDETVYTPCLYGNFPASNHNFGETVEIRINRGPYLSATDGGVKIGTWYQTGKVIYLKFRTQNRESYDFWTSWQNEVLNAQNPIFPAHTDLKSNVRGGTGCWCGFGVTNHMISTYSY